MVFKGDDSCGCDVTQSVGVSWSGATMGELGLLAHVMMTGAATVTGPRQRSGWGTGQPASQIFDDQQSQLSTVGGRLFYWRALVVVVMMMVMMRVVVGVMIMRLMVMMMIMSMVMAVVLMTMIAMMAMMMVAAMVVVMASQQKSAACSEREWPTL
jgi:hypothetical protein